LVHDAKATARTFGAGADDYVRILATEPAETFAFWDHGLELSRRFRALKLWATLRFHGGDRLAAVIGEDIRLADHLADLVAVADDFELLAGPGLSICCFRHTPTYVDEAALDAHNERILHALQRDGRVYLSNASASARRRACSDLKKRSSRDHAIRAGLPKLGSWWAASFV
jgi:glutamate/tyrosine decarboxylase-like PLP-dependent enzyme